MERKPLCSLDFDLRRPSLHTIFGVGILDDAQSLVPLVDCGLFVLNADSTPISAASEALAMLQDKGAGCVVNRSFGYDYGSKHTEN